MKYLFFTLLFSSQFLTAQIPGTIKWEFQTGGNVQSSPAIGSDGTVYVGSNDSSLYAINPDGTKKWEFKTGDGVYSSPSISSDGHTVSAKVQGQSQQR